MGQSLYLPAAALVVGVVATLFFVRPAHQMPPGAPAAPADVAPDGATHAG